MSLNSKHERIWLLIMMTAGFCSLIYELALAQLLTGLLGGAMARFATTLGVYIVGMGIGSVSFRAKNDHSDGQTFLIAETALAIIGLTAPFLFVLSYRLALNLFRAADDQTFFVLICTHVIIFATGFFSGRELPILSTIIGRTVKSSADATVLAADYLGMFLASLVFPFVLYPVAGLVATFAIATLLNLLAAVLTIYLLRGWRARLINAALFSLVCLNIVAIFYSTTLQDWLSKLYETSA